MSTQSCYPEVLLNLVRQACYSSCSATHRKLVEDAEKLELEPSFIPILWACITNTLCPANTCDNMRVMAAILLKNCLQKVIKGDVELDHELLTTLCREVQNYIELENHCLEKQLCTIFGLLVLRCWPKQWPELVPTLVSQLTEVSRGSQPPWLAVHLLGRVHEALGNLSTRLHCPAYAQLYGELCWSLFSPIMKVWVPTLRDINSSLASHPLPQVVTSESVSSLTFPRDLDSERIFCLATRTSKTLSLVLQSGLPLIAERNCCFRNFFKTYVSVIAPLSERVRKSRPFYRLLFLENGTTCTSTPQDAFWSRKQPQDWIFFCEDEQGSCIDSSECFDISHLRGAAGGFYAQCHLLLGLTRSLTCTPVILQRKHPEILQPMLEPLLAFYTAHLQLDFPLDRPFDRTLASSVLPLRRLAFASLSLLANVSTRVLREESKFLGTTTPVTVTADVHNAGERKSLRDFFCESRAVHLLELMLSALLPWSVQELETWSQDPESFFASQLTEADDFCLRTAAERLCMSLLSLCPGAITGCLISKLIDTEAQARLAGCVGVCPRQSTSQNDCTSCDSELLYWDGVYHCSSLCADQLLARGFSLSTWSSEVLGPLLSQLQGAPRAGCLSSGQPILRVRLLRLLASWTDVLEPSLLAPIASFLCDSLSRKEDDLVPQLFTAQALEALLMARRCSLQTLQPQVTLIAQHLVTLISRVMEDLEIRRYLVRLLRDVLHLAQGSDASQCDFKPLFHQILTQLAPFPIAYLVATAAQLRQGQQVCASPVHSANIFQPLLCELLYSVVTTVASQDDTTVSLSADEGTRDALFGFLGSCVLTQEAQVETISLLHALLKGDPRFWDNGVPVIVWLIKSWVEQLWYLRRGFSENGSPLTPQQADSMATTDASVAVLIHCLEIVVIFASSDDMGCGSLEAPLKLMSDSDIGVISWLHGPEVCRLAALRLLSTTVVLHPTCVDRLWLPPLLIPLLSSALTCADCPNLASVCRALTSRQECNTSNDESQTWLILDVLAALLLSSFASVPNASISTALPIVSHVLTELCESILSFLQLSAGSREQLSEFILLDQLRRVFLFQLPRMSQAAVPACLFRVRMWLQAVSVLCHMETVETLLPVSLQATPIDLATWQCEALNAMETLLLGTLPLLQNISFEERAEIMVQLAGEWICEPSDTHAASAFAFAPVRILHESSVAQVEARVIEFEGILRDIFGSPQWLYKRVRSEKLPGNGTIPSGDVELRVAEESIRVLYRKVLGERLTVHASAWSGVLRR